MRTTGTVTTEVMKVLLYNTIGKYYVPSFSDQQKARLVDYLDQTIEMMVRYVTCFGNGPSEHTNTEQQLMSFFQW